MSLMSENFDPTFMTRVKEDEYESKSGSENLDGGAASGDEHGPSGGGDGGNKTARRKRYHRHTPQQIQELESFFKDCPHPDEKQRLELSRRLNLETKQVKFWFQNRRTQKKTQGERYENMILRQENDKLHAENCRMKEAMQHPICNNCGGPAVLAEISFEEHSLRVENSRLNDELERIRSLLGNSASQLHGIGPLHVPNSSLELAAARNGFGGLLPPMGTTPPMGLDLEDGVSSMLPMSLPPARPVTTMSCSTDRTFLKEHALIAMQELIGMIEGDSPLWIKDMDGGREVLNHEEYRRKFKPLWLGTKPAAGFVTEATRETCMVNINSLDLVETLMDVDQWAKMFPHLIARSSIMEVMPSSFGGTRNDTLQLMQAEFQVLSPLVPVRHVKFLRFCKQHAEGMWAIVDVSLDIIQQSSNVTSYVSCRRLPSGCIVQDALGGSCSKVSWLEHSEYDESTIDSLYRPLISSGMAFGAPRWVATLQRQCEVPALGNIPEISSNSQKQMLNLAQHMVDNFCSGACTSVKGNWELVDARNVGTTNLRLKVRTIIDRPGELHSVVLSAATSVHIPVQHQQLFNFLRDERLRSQWDILSNGGALHEMVNFPKGREPGNCVSLLRASTIMSANQGNTLILQETWTDVSGSLIVYSPVEYAAIQAVMSGRESVYVALRPSGFAIVPDCCGGHGLNSCYGSTLVNGCDGNSGGSNGDGSGSLLTIGLQILLNSLPTSSLTPESVHGVSNIISCTVQRIKDAVRNARCKN